MSGEFCLIVTTTGTIESARTIASHLLESKLAACVQIFPIESHYVWQGKIQHDSEYALHIKSMSLHFVAVKNAVESVHPYDVPEVIRLDIEEGNESYLDWLKQSLRT